MCVSVQGRIWLVDEVLKDLIITGHYFFFIILLIFFPIWDLLISGFNLMSWSPDRLITKAEVGGKVGGGSSDSGFHQAAPRPSPQPLSPTPGGCGARDSAQTMFQFHDSRKCVIGLEQSEYSPVQFYGS